MVTISSPREAAADQPKLIRISPIKNNNLQLMMNTPVSTTRNGADFPTPMWKRKSKSSLVSLRPTLLASNRFVLPMQSKRTKRKRRMPAKMQISYKLFINMAPLSSAFRHSSHKQMLIIPSESPRAPKVSQIQSRLTPKKRKISHVRGEIGNDDFSDDQERALHEAIQAAIAEASLSTNRPIGGEDEENLQLAMEASRNPPKAPRTFQSISPMHVYINSRFSTHTVSMS